MVLFNLVCGVNFVMDSVFCFNMNDDLIDVFMLVIFVCVEKVVKDGMLLLLVLLVEFVVGDFGVMLGSVLGVGLKVCVVMLKCDVVIGNVVGGVWMFWVEVLIVNYDVFVDMFVKMVVMVVMMSYGGFFGGFGGVGGVLCGLGGFLGGLGGFFGGGLVGGDVIYGRFVGMMMLFV